MIWWILLWLSLVAAGVIVVYLYFDSSNNPGDGLNLHWDGEDDGAPPPEEWRSAPIGQGKIAAYAAWHQHRLEKAVSDKIDVTQHIGIDYADGEDQTAYMLCLSDGSRYEIVDHGEVHGAKAVAVGPASWVEMAKRFPRITCKEIPGLVIDILLIEPGLVAFPSFKGSLVVVGYSPAKK